MSLLYLAALLVSLLGMVVLDARFGLFFWRSPRRAALVVAAGVLFFLAWDLAGIAAGVFFRGAGPLLTGVLLAPELPLEEAFFLALLCYVTMIAFCSAARLLERRSGERP
ncbi:MAG: carotenoid epsilon cyclase [Naasia sp.]|uniref:lycopene cyclase domain-containing protein n=1 Tax=Naasia sp. TaxID=2546198 RepID=UPI00261CE961|nr:lycopene cyclase domain-containing protein [Naasia sp.]MCU1570320.1 carotenoid epsilon cyclase [Naasia sp.]